MIGLVLFIAVVAGGHAVLARFALKHNRRYDLEWRIAERRIDVEGRIRRILYP